MPKLSTRVLLSHIFFCTLFLVLPVLISSRPDGEPFLKITRPFVRDIMANALLLCFFYLNYYLFIPKFYLPKKYVLYAFCVILCFAAVVILPSVFTGRFDIRPYEGPPLPKQQPVMPPNHNSGIISFLFSEVRHHLYLFVIALFFSILLRTREYLSQVKEDKLQAELCSLKSQINPHFLFNTLNSIYILSIKKDERVSDAIISLSGLMRYVIKDSRDYKIPLQTEIEYLVNYIELQKARLGDTANVRFQCFGDPGDKQISPLILITYIENAFKYGVNPDVDNCVVEITLLVTETGIQLTTFNKKIPLRTGEPATGIGIRNTRERLKLLYPDRHMVEIKETTETYSVVLSIDLI
ncbi:MAG: sensor histidine kinase [Agriterribacter sp.]